MAEMTKSKGQEVRLQKILAAAGVASRRASEELIRAGRVWVNGELASIGQSADSTRDTIAVDGVPIEAEQLEYWILNKPKGVVTTASDPEGRQTVLDLIPNSSARLFPVGRLDFLTEGLVLLTNDGPLAHSLLHPSFGTEREYQVTVRGGVQPETLEQLADGVELEDGITAPARVSAARFDRPTRTSIFSLTMIEGKKRQIRRAMEALGHPVVRLIRIRMGPIELGTLQTGEARPLRSRERRTLIRNQQRASEARQARN
jgi:23S rRNA pseudouridine2605 synthase